VLHWITRFKPKD